MNRYTTSIKPENIPNGWVVMRATRPLLGDMKWRDEWANRWHVAINPETKDAQRMIDHNFGLDGCIVHYVAEDKVLSAYLADLPDKLSSRYHVGLRVMCIKNAIRKLDDGSMTM